MVVSINKNQPLKQMSESTRLGFCNDNIAGVLTLNSTIQSLAGVSDPLNGNTFSVDTDGNTIIYGTLDVSGKSQIFGGLNLYGDFFLNGTSIFGGGGGGGGSGGLEL